MSKIKTKDTETQLKKETLKWLKKIKKERKNIKLKNKKISLENIDAYIEDCEYFLKKEVLIEAFEAVIYAYGLLDMLKALDYIEIKPHK